MDTQKHRLVILGSVMGMVVLAAAGWFLVAQPQLDAASALDLQREDAEAQIAVNAAQVATLRADSENIDEIQAQLDALRASIPADLDPSAYLEGLNALATTHGVSISALTVTDAMAYAPPAVETTEATDATAEEGAEQATAPVETDPSTTVYTEGAITPENFVLIPVTVTVDGSWDNVLGFVSGLQTGSRLFLVTALSTGQNAANEGTVTGTITGYIYAIPTGATGDPEPVSFPESTPKVMGSSSSTEDDATGGESSTDDAESTDPETESTEPPTP